MPPAVNDMLGDPSLQTANRGRHTAWNEIVRLYPNLDPTPGSRLDGFPGRPVLWGPTMSDPSLTTAQELLRDLWEAHVRYEFATRNTEGTLATVVEDAYVNHIPVLTGGVGREALREFYSRRFIPQMRVEIPLVAIVRFRDGKLAHEHIYWDQASALVQLGLLDPAILPVAGRETARKALDPRLPSNALIERADRARRSPPAVPPSRI